MDNDYLNLTALLEKGSENGGIDEISDNWFDQTGGWNHLYAPNAIDPNLFFDASGEKLYMSYGSWSGGLFLLELDPATGEAFIRVSTPPMRSPAISWTATSASILQAAIISPAKLRISSMIRRPATTICMKLMVV